MAEMTDSMCLLTPGAVTLRLMLAMLTGAVIGYGRARKKANAGLRTYMLTCIGACLTMEVALYEYAMLKGQWADAVALLGLKYDGSRFSAQVVTGIGFLAAGTIIAAGHHQVSGLTSAIGLFACAALGIACGAGFYECVAVAVVMIVFTMEFMAPMERAFKRRLRNITVFVEFDDPGDVDTITATIRREGAQLYDLDIEHTDKADERSPSAIMTLKLNRENPSHSAILSSLAELPCVNSVQELIA